MNNKYLEIIEEVKNNCSSDEQFDLILIASILELSSFLEKEDFYKDKLNAMADEKAHTKFPKLYQYLIDICLELSKREEVEAEVILEETLHAFFEEYEDTDENDEDSSEELAD